MRKREMLVILSGMQDIKGYMIHHNTASCRYMSRAEVKGRHLTKREGPLIPDDTALCEGSIANRKLIRFSVSFVS